MSDNELIVEDTMAARGVFKISLSSPTSLYAVAKRLFEVSKSAEIIEPGDYTVTVIMSFAKESS